MTTTLAEQRESLVAQAFQIAEAAKEAKRDLTAEEQGKIADLLEQVKAVDTAMDSAEKSASLLAGLAALSNDAHVDLEAKPDGKAASLGEHFVKSSAYTEMKDRKGVTRFTTGTAEYKAATDPTLSTGLGQVQYGGVVATPLARPVIADLLSSGTLSGTSLTYFEQGPVTGAPGFIAENTEKPAINFTFTPTTENLAKIAGVTKITDETSEDAAAVVSIINSQLRLRLTLAEEDGLLNGNGTAPNLRGIYNRAIGTEAAADDTDNLDAIYRGMVKVQLDTQLSPDALAIHPLDYQARRLGKDANGQYYGGGPFTGAYGNGGIVEVPSVWGLRTVVSTAVTQGSPLVGAWKAGGQVFRKGGVRIETTNSDDDDFRFNRIAIRAEERLLLAVYIPKAFVKVTLSVTPPVVQSASKSK